MPISRLSGPTQWLFRKPPAESKLLAATEDAVPLLVGIEHDEEECEWTFTGWRLVDLSTLQVRLKAEFQASNADLYRNAELSRTTPK